MRVSTFSIAVVCVFAGGTLSAGMIVPNANAAAPGNTDNRFPFLVNGGMRSQQVFAADQFSGPIDIGELDLRNGVFVDTPFTSTISDIQIWLSTVSAAPDALSATFANNIGADNTLVYDGSLTLSSTNAPGPGGTHVFDVVINLQNTFSYNPALGNLLLDIKNISGADAFVGTNFFDTQNTSGDSMSRVYGGEGSPDATSGSADTLGLILQFNPPANVPEPSSFALVGLGVALAGLRRFRPKGATAN